MGKGDRRSRKGKIWAHSYGVTRKRKKHKRPAFVPKVKKEKKVKLPQQVEQQVAEAIVEGPVLVSTEKGMEPLGANPSVATEQVAVAEAKPAKAKKAPAKKKEPAAKKEGAPKKKAPAKKKSK